MVLWFGELRFAGKLQLWTWKKNLNTELPCFSLQWIQLRTSFLLSLHCHGRMDFELTDFWFAATSNRMPFLANVVNLHFMFFLAFGFHRKPWGQTSSMSLPFYERFADLTWFTQQQGEDLQLELLLSHQELEDRVKKQLQYCIARSWALIDRVEEQIRSIGLQLGRAQEELLPDRRYNWTELVAVWIFSILRSFQLAKALRLRLLAFVKRNFYKARLLLKALVTWLRRPTESWTLGWAIRCFQLRMWTINFYFPMWRKLMETCWRIFFRSRSTWEHVCDLNFGRWWSKTSLRFCAWEKADFSCSLVSLCSSKSED